MQIFRSDGASNDWTAPHTIIAYSKRILNSGERSFTDGQTGSQRRT